MDDDDDDIPSLTTVFGWDFARRGYALEPRLRLVSLRILCEQGRATPPDHGFFRARDAFDRLDALAGQFITAFCLSNPVGLVGRLFPSPEGDGPVLPIELFWRVLSFWRYEGDLVWGGVCDSKHVGLCRVRYTTTPGLFTPSDAVAQP